MRYLILFLPLLFLGVSCVKPPSDDPVPTLEFRDVQNMRKVTTLSNGVPVSRDTAVLVLRYSDGDGDIFRNNNADGPNLIYTTYAYNTDSAKFFVDGFANPATITQPADGYYVGKSIHGDIYVPMTQFRSSDKIKIIKFDAFMVDMKNHKSNVVVSPVYTLNF